MTVLTLICPRCGGSNLEPGSLHGGVSFRPKHRRFFSLRLSVPLSAKACWDCGYVQLNVETHELEKLLPRPDPRPGFPVTPLAPPDKPGS